MPSFKDRAEARRSKISLNKIGLHSKEHHSFHLDTDGDILSRLVFDMSHTKIENNNSMDTYGVDKTQIRIIKLRDK